jgi:hypothetical protein
VSTPDQTEKSSFSVGDFIYNVVDILAVPVLIGCISVILVYAGFWIGSNGQKLEDQLLHMGERAAWHKSAIDAGVAFYHPTTGAFTFKSAGPAVSVTATQAIEASK